MKIYTKTGDNGSTGLYGGTRISKSHKKINAYGTIDELNSYVGLLRDLPVNAERKNFLKEIQKNLFVIGSILATDYSKKNLKLLELGNNADEIIEKEIDAMEQELIPLSNFILPGGHIYVSYGHIARCVCRRAEREVVELSELEETNIQIIPYLNRLSDYLFVLSRKMAKELNVEENIWTTT